eukprot:364192-Chlamydomonas_euryale.AAC.13
MKVWGSGCTRAGLIDPLVAPIDKILRARRSPRRSVPSGADGTGRAMARGTLTWAGARQAGGGESVMYKALSEAADMKMRRLGGAGGLAGVRRHGSERAVGGGWVGRLLNK